METSNDRRTGVSPPLRKQYAGQITPQAGSWILIENGESRKRRGGAASVPNPKLAASATNPLRLLTPHPSLLSRKLRPQLDLVLARGGEEFFRVGAGPHDV